MNKEKAILQNYTIMLITYSFVLIVFTFMDTEVSDCWMVTYSFKSIFTLIYTTIILIINLLSTYQSQFTCTLVRMITRELIFVRTILLTVLELDYLYLSIIWYYVIHVNYWKSHNANYMVAFNAELPQLWAPRQMHQKNLLCHHSDPCKCPSSSERVSRPIQGWNS